MTQPNSVKALKEVGIIDLSPVRLRFDMICATYTIRCGQTRFKYRKVHCPDNVTIVVRLLLHMKMLKLEIVSVSLRPKF